MFLIFISFSLAFCFFCHHFGSLNIPSFFCLILFTYIIDIRFLFWSFGYNLGIFLHVFLAHLFASDI